MTHTQNIKPYWLGVVALEILKTMSYAKSQKPLNQADVNQDSFQGVTAKHTFLLKTTLQVFKLINCLNQLIPHRTKYIFMGSYYCYCSYYDYYWSLTRVMHGAIEQHDDD